jgi:hypothetical protein
MAAEARRERRQAWALAVLLLAIGAAAGVAADRLMLRAGRGDERRGPPGPAAMAERLTLELDLTDDQSRAVRQILDERWDALATIFARVDPEAEAIRRSANDRIRALLQPSQRERFEARVAEIERRRAEMRRRVGRDR